MCACVLSHFSCVQLFVTLRTVACQAPLSMGFSKQECWSGLPFCPPGDLSGPGIELSSLRSSDLAGRFFTTGATWEAHTCVYVFLSHGEKVGYWGEKESKKNQRQVTDKTFVSLHRTSKPLWTTEGRSRHPLLFGVAYTWVCWTIAVGRTYHWSTAPIWRLSTFCQGIR